MFSQLGPRPSGYLWENVSLWASSLEKHCTRAWLSSVVPHPTHQIAENSSSSGCPLATKWKILTIIVVC